MAHSCITIPDLTMTYQDDMPNKIPEETKEYIPFCTLRNEPQSVNHCTEWAISKFEDHFNKGLSDLRVFLDTTLPQTDLSVGQVESLIKILEWLDGNRCYVTLESCLR